MLIKLVPVLESTRYVKCGKITLSNCITLCLMGVLVACFNKTV